MAHFNLDLEQKKRLNDDINAPRCYEGGFYMDINVSSSVCVGLNGIKEVWGGENISFVSHLKPPVHTGRWGDEALWRTLDGRTGDCPSSKSVFSEAPSLSQSLRSLQEGKVSPVPSTFSPERRVPTRCCPPALITTLPSHYRAEYRRQCSSGSRLLRTGHTVHTIESINVRPTTHLYTCREKFEM